MWQDIPVWFRIWFVFCVVAGITCMAYALHECGAKALLLGDGAAMAALMGMCD